MTKISNDAVYIVEDVSDLDSPDWGLTEIHSQKKPKIPLGQLKAYFKSGL
jgi:hypothetical protein